MIYTEGYLQDLQRTCAGIPALERLSGSRILITGAGGLICSALVDLLLSARLDITVVAAGRDPEKLKKRFAHWTGEKLQLLSYDALHPLQTQQDFDYLIHGASPAHPGAYAAEPVQTMQANFVGMLNILEYARQHRAKRVLYVSSSEVYGKKEGAQPYRQEEYGFVDILNPRACYPSAKRAAETLCAAFTAQYGLDTVIVRPGHVYGPTATGTDSRASSQFPRDAKAGKDIVMKSAGSQLRSYCYVLDCVSAMVTVLLKGETGKAYNISNRDSVVTIREMAEAFAVAAGVRVVFDTPTDAEKKSYNLMDNSALDATELEKLGWKGLYSMEAGAKATLDAIEG